MKTALYDVHIASGGKIVDFFGWELPVSYDSIINEHNHVRNHAGIFDVSHMGEISITGDESTKFLQYVLTADVKDSFNKNKAVYSVMCYENGCAVDDLIVYGVGEKEYLLIVNASNTKKDFNWLKKQSESFDVTVSNVSGDYSQIALQGPKSQEVLNPLCDFNLSDLKFFRFVKCKVNSIECLISRTGYTGEDGFEIYVNPKDVLSVWETLKEYEDVKPIGLGARDTLRFEACLPLYGHELSENITPIDAGLKRFVKFDKGNFIGKSALEKQNKLLIGLKMTGKGIPRDGYEVYKDNKKVGVVTSGSFCPYLNDTYAICLVDNKTYADENFNVKIRKRMVEAKRVKMPFYNKKYKK